MGSNSTTQRKFDDLVNFFKDKGKVLVAFSGGVDSSVVTAVAKTILGSGVVAVTASSITLPPWELENSKQIAEVIGVKHIIVKIDELENSLITENPPDRCYYCKKELIVILKKVAMEEGARVIVDGTNADDLKGHRPGALALKEEGVYSPLALAGLTKREVREIAIHLKLPNADKPSMACLASRFPYGQRMTYEGIKRVAGAEKYIMDLVKARQVRVRDHNNIARIELGRNERKLLYNEDLMDKVVKKLKSLGFNYVTMDLQGYRSGSMDEVL
ncbi:MAG: ATP-dependent sacrificial sulfur transferase LarE [archaeon]|nr:ATP-dependent sacrificial sulfur transferase LarE [archaeon]MCP8306766.1 ATP-dependent sacrificial sulfur transferase LarE [archaeon]